MIRSLLALSTFIVLLFAPHSLQAQAYPKQPINLIIPLTQTKNIKNNTYVVLTGKYNLYALSLIRFKTWK